MLRCAPRPENVTGGVLRRRRPKSRMRSPSPTAAVLASRVAAEAVRVTVIPVSIPVGPNSSSSAMLSRAPSSATVARTPRTRPRTTTLAAPKVRVRHTIGTAPPGDNRGRILNLNSVKPATARRYTQLLNRFDDFVIKVFKVAARNLDPPTELDHNLAEFVNELVRESEKMHTATAVWAAVGRRHPEVSRTSSVATVCGLCDHSQNASEAPTESTSYSADIDERLPPARRGGTAESGTVHPPQPGGGLSNFWQLVLHPSELGLPSKIGGSTTTP